MKIRNLIFFIILLLHVVPTNEQTIRIDDKQISSSLKSVCNINRADFGQFERVQITSSSINIQFKNIFDNSKCLTIFIDALINNFDANEFNRTIKNIQSNTIDIDQLLPNQNYSIILKISDGKIARILPAYIFQTRSFENQTPLILSNGDLLSIDQIESHLFPSTLFYFVTLSSQIQRTNLLGTISFSSIFNQTQYQSSFIVKPLDNHVISRMGRPTKKILVFSIELPLENLHFHQYQSSLRLFFVNDPHQSIVDHPISVKPSQSITVDFLPLSTRSIRILLRHLCLSYIEVKATVYHHSKIISRQQCDINKKENSLFDIANGRCTIRVDQLQPEENYTLSIRSTCPITTSSSTFAFYDRTRNFTFQTSAGLPDDSPLILAFLNNNRTLIWTNQSYLGPDYYYELYTKSNDNWTLIYRGNETQYQLNKKFIEKTNLIFRIYVANRYGRQEKNYTQIQINIDPIHHWNFNNQIVSFTILISFLLLLLFGFLFFGCYVRNKKLYGKLRKKYCQDGNSSDKELEHLRSLKYSNTLKDNILYTWNHTPTNVDLNKLPKIERTAIKLDRLIGKGAFGEVYAGKIVSDQSVAIKTLLCSATPSQRTDFLKEAIIMNQFDHEHIIHLLGVCFHNDFQPQFLVIELMEQGDLQNYLRRSRPNKINLHCQLSYDDCLEIARQIADGACYLEQHSYVHRDLAARNCLVSFTDKILVKIGDFGLARMLSQQDYYRKTGEALLPVRWMAPESLLDALFTSQSDVWSFGIVLWEIITLGQVPYSPLNNQQVISLITTTRGTLAKPMQCTQTLYELMVSCWHYVPENRIHFLDIHTHLTEILSDSNKEQPSIWFTNQSSSSSSSSSQTARNILDGVLSHIEPPTSLSFESSDAGECRSSTSGCFSSMTESSSQIPPTCHPNQLVPSYQLRLIDDTTSNDFVDDDHSDIVVRSF